ATVVPATLMSGAIGATLAAAGTSAALSSAQVVDDIFALTDDMPDTKLREESAYYDGLRSMGMDETTARKELNRHMRGLKPALVALVSAATSVFGPAGQIARAMRGGTAAIGAGERGLIGRTAAGVAEGTASEAIEGGTQNIAVQVAGMAGGVRKSFSVRELLDATLEEGLRGGVFSGGASAVPPKRRKAPQREVTDDESASTRWSYVAQPPRRQAPQREVTNDEVAQPPRTTTTSTPIKPPEDVAIGNPESAPTRSETRYSKMANDAVDRVRKKGVTLDDTAVAELLYRAEGLRRQFKGKELSTELKKLLNVFYARGVQPIEPDAAQMAALTATQPPPAPTPVPEPVPPTAVAPQQPTELQA